MKSDQQPKLRCIIMNIPLPKKLNIIPDKEKPYAAKVEITPLYPGYGHTLGNSLRRVLLSSLEGAGITAVHIQGADHEFMSIPHVKEEVLEIILNLKQLNFKMHSDDKERIKLKVKGKKVVTAADFDKNSNVELINTDQHIASLNHKDATLEMEVVIEKGMGFSPVEEREKETEVGVISIDTVFSPMKSVGFSVTDVRVGKKTDYDKLTLSVETDGTIDVQEAMERATKILVDHFNVVADKLAGKEEDQSAEEDEATDESESEDEVKEEETEE